MYTSNLPYKSIVFKNDTIVYRNYIGENKPISYEEMKKENYIDQDGKVTILGTWKGLRKVIFE